jgi:hypothetical protein
MDGTHSMRFNDRLTPETHQEMRSIVGRRSTEQQVTVALKLRDNNELGTRNRISEFLEMGVLDHPR